MNLWSRKQKNVVRFSYQWDGVQELIRGAMKYVSEGKYSEAIRNLDASDKDQYNAMVADYCLIELTLDRFSILDMIRKYDSDEEFCNSKEYRQAMDMLNNMNAAITLLEYLISGKATLDINLKRFT